MQVLDRTGVGTLWSICKTKFALAGHTHNSLAAVGSEQISATAYGSGLHFKPYYSSGGPTTYGNILEYTSTNTGGGQLAMEWTGSQTKSDGTDSNVGRVYYRSKRDCINGWTKWMALAYTNDIPTKLSQLTNDEGFVTGSVSGNTVTINGVSTTWTNTWRGIQDNLTSNSTSESLSANQGRVLKGLVDGKANSSHTHSWSQISGTPDTATRWPSWGEVTGKPGSFTPSSHTHDWSQVTGKPELKNWSDIKAYIDNKFSSSSGVKRIINIDFISTRAPETIYDHTNNNFRLSAAILDWNGGAIFCTVYNKKIYYGYFYRYNHESNNQQWLKNAFSDKSYATIDPRGEFYHGVVDSDTILNLHGTFYNADLQQCDSNGNVLA